MAYYRSNSPIIGYSGHIPGEKWHVGSRMRKSNMDQSSSTLFSDEMHHNGHFDNDHQSRHEAIENTSIETASSVTDGSCTYNWEGNPIRKNRSLSRNKVNHQQALQYYSNTDRLGFEGVETRLQQQQHRLQQDEQSIIRNENKLSEKNNFVAEEHYPEWQKSRNSSSPTSVPYPLESKIPIPSSLYHSNNQTNRISNEGNTIMPKRQAINTNQFMEDGTEKEKQKQWSEGNYNDKLSHYSRKSTINDRNRMNEMNFIARNYTHGSEKSLSSELNSYKDIDERQQRFYDDNKTECDSIQQDRSIISTENGDHHEERTVISNDDTAENDSNYCEQSQHSISIDKVNESGRIFSGEIQLKNSEAQKGSGVSQYHINCCSTRNHPSERKVDNLCDQYVEDNAWTEGQALKNIRAYQRSLAEVNMHNVDKKDTHMPPTEYKNPIVDEESILDKEEDCDIPAPGYSGHIPAKESSMRRHHYNQTNVSPIENQQNRSSLIQTPCSETLRSSSRRQASREKNEQNKQTPY